jgi:hypothetical protein
MATLDLFVAFEQGLQFADHLSDHFDALFHGCLELGDHSLEFTGEGQGLLLVGLSQKLRVDLEPFRF